jgi:hypothetical protein
MDLDRPIGRSSREIDRMPAQTVGQLKVKVESLRKVIADQGESTEALKRREAAKKLRRAQRKRRRLVALAASTAAKPKTAEDAAAAPAADAPADTPKAESGAE